VVGSVVVDPVVVGSGVLGHGRDLPRLRGLMHRGREGTVAARPPG